MGTSRSGVRNFLFLSTSICDESCGFQCIHKKLLAAAQGMAEEGYVYFAEVGRKLMEDDELGVRHLGFDPTRLPSFGQLSVVVVLNDTELMTLAHQAYPDAHIYLFENSSQIETIAGQLAFNSHLRAAA